MQYIRDIHAAKRNAKLPVISFEFFPPKGEQGTERLLDYFRGRTVLLLEPDIDPTRAVPYRPVTPP